MAFSMACGGPSGPQINVTPLIDVLLTLIVVFMIVVAMEQDKGERVRFLNRRHSRLRSKSNRGPS
jgi:biopolymer transport protein ExbD